MKEAGRNSIVTRRQLLLGGAGAVFLTGVAGLLEPGRVTVERNRILSGVGASGPVVRLVQLSDLHLQEFDSHAEAVARRVNDLGPDVIVITGDAIDRSDRLSVLAAFLEALDSRSAKLATLGNWEHWAHVDLAGMEDTYARYGCTLLVNRSVTIDAGMTHVVVTGLDDSTGGRPDPQAALAGVPVTANHIVLTHSPAYRDALSSWLKQNADAGKHRIACILAGHTHGGQVNLFGWAPVRPPGSGPYVSGWYRENGLPLYVSRGIGTSVAPIRLGAPPEISVFEWQTAAD